MGLEQAQADRSRYYDDNRESVVFHDLLKGRRKRPSGVPAGFSFIPKSKHNGYRKRKGDHWIYWYPDQHQHADHLDWEPDLAAGTGVGGIKAGQFVAIVGKPGAIYAWTPDARAHKDGKTWITPVDPDDGHIHGKPILVESGQLQPQKSFDPASRRKRRQSRKKAAAKRGKVSTRRNKAPTRTKAPARRKKAPARRKKAPPQTSPEAKLHRRRMQRQAELMQKITEAKELLGRTGRKALRSPYRIARLKVAIADAQEGLRNLRDDVVPGSYDPSEEARTIVFEDSRAEKGTFLHKLENGYYPLLAFESNDRFLDEGTKARSTGVFVPPQDVQGLFEEFGPLMGSAAKKISNTYRIRTPEGRQDVLSGAKLGLMLALRSYSWGVPFAQHAQRFTTVYAMRAARDVLGGGASTIPMRQMQMLHGLIAARARARARARTVLVDGKRVYAGSDKDTISPEAIAKEWRIPKSQTFTGRSGTLGKYVRTIRRGKRKGEQIVVDQAAEQVPMEDWQVRGPDGKPTGKLYLGKRKLVAAMLPILEGNRVEDSEWMNQHEGNLVPPGADASLPQGMKHALRSKIDEIMEGVSERNQEVLSVLYGLDASPFEVRGQSTGRVRGADYAVNAEDLATLLGLADKGDKLRDKQRLARVAVEHAEREFRASAAALGYDDVGKRSASWNRMLTVEKPEFRVPKGPTYNELAERFGGHDRVAIYGTAVRAGEGEKVAKLLDRWKGGKLTARQRGKLLREHQKRRDAERLKMARIQTAHREVDPSEVREPTGGQSDPESVWLYTDEMLLDAAQAIANGASSGQPIRPRTSRSSKVWDEARFQRYMGRATQYAAARGGDNG